MVYISYYVLYILQANFAQYFKISLADIKYLLLWCVTLINTYLDDRQWLNYTQQFQRKIMDDFNVDALKTFFLASCLLEADISRYISPFLCILQDRFIWGTILECSVDHRLKYETNKQNSHRMPLIWMPLKHLSLLPVYSHFTVPISLCKTVGRTPLNAV